MVFSTATLPASSTATSSSVEAQSVGHALRRLGHLADHREHGALDRLLDGAISAGGALRKSLFEIGGGEVCGAAPHVAEAADDLRKDDARVAARAHERALGDRGGHGRDALDVALLQLFEDGTHGERQVGARVAVRHRIDVEVVDDAALRLDGGESGVDDRDGGVPDAQSCRSSTRTLIWPSGTPADLRDLVTHLLLQVGRHLREIDAALHDDVKADVGGAVLDFDLDAFGE